MKTETGVTKQLETTPQAHDSIRFIASRDGTALGYRQLGRGPGLLVMHGIMESSQSHMQLAEALADTFTVYLPDRRGRGLSGPYGDDFSIQKEVEDIEALLAQTGAQYVFGISVGALGCLQSALQLPSIRKVAIFEPPLIVGGSVSTDFLARYDKEMAEGDVVSAMVTGMLGAQMGPPIFGSLPRWLLKMLTKMMIAGEEKYAKEDSVTMRMLAPTMHQDLRLAIEMEQTLESLREIRTEMLLLGSGKSPAYFKIALDALEKVIPHAKRIVFPDFHHGATGNSNRGGQPKRVAEELRRFFT